jgi:DNA polymerase/3'-5' exonuclease PolX
LNFRQKTEKTKAFFQKISTFQIMSTSSSKLPLLQAQRLAARLVEILSPHCEIIDIAGSIRREAPQVGDIEIVCQPKMIESGFLGLDYEISPAFFQALAPFKRLMGKPENKQARYFKYEIPIQKGSIATVNLDLFIPQPHDYYRQLAIRTGSSNYSANVIALGWRKKGWVGTADGLRREEEVEKKGDAWICDFDEPTMPPVWDSEKAFFEWLGVAWREPIDRG